MNTNPTETQVISVPDGSIRDYVDGTFRKDTPEEYVRQTIEKRLVNEHKYKREQIKVEFGLKLGSRRPRADIVVFPKDSPEMTQDQVWLLEQEALRVLDEKDDRIEEAVQKWRSIAIIVEEVDKNLAARAWNSVGYLLSKQDDQAEDVILAYDRAVEMKANYADAYCNRGEQKITELVVLDLRSF